ncbi:uncharacterized protein LOC122611618 isoform X2 [Drosophila teissieri]|uniref:uncharacterized protein LOC122611618 isoform X2 n=1 Tax=Drosophila teissieri TaxID=7243 RepID=UPI001CBA24A2|nr:uncharacterized protein LOC122611618 isoform X2 [Drosophila teissieri]
MERCCLYYRFAALPIYRSLPDWHVWRKAYNYTSEDSSERRLASGARVTAMTREIAWLQFPTGATWANVKLPVKPTQTGNTSEAPRPSFSWLEMASLAGWRRDQVS